MIQINITIIFFYWKYPFTHTHTSSHIICAIIKIKPITRRLCVNKGSIGSLNKYYVAFFATSRITVHSPELSLLNAICLITPNSISLNYGIWVPFPLLLMYIKS
jgi:hypothetical protein